MHSLSDFGQHLPANAMLTAVCCALLVSLARLPSRGWAPAIAPPARSGRLAYLTLAAIAAGAFGWALAGANAARVAESHGNKARAVAQQAEEFQWRLGEEATTYLFTHAVAAVEAEPDNIHHWHRLGIYKWMSLTPFVDPNTHLLAPEALPWARQIVEELHQVRSLCPTFGVLPCLAGEIEKFALADPKGADRILRAYQLAPCNATVCFAAARVDAEAGRIDEAFEKLARATLLDGRTFPAAAVLCIDGLARPDLAMELAGDQVGRLSHVADLLGASDQHTELEQQVRARALGLLAAWSQQTDAPAVTHVSLARSDLERGDSDAAIERYRQALKKNYGHVGWHYELASLLAQAGRVEEAMHEARICLRLRSDHRPARRLLEELSLLPVAAASEQ